MAQAEVRNTAGGVVSTVDLNESIFGVERNDTLIHQAILRIQANRRAGTHDTKTRGEVSGTTAKWYRQKGTGRARHGAQTAPQFRKGGVVFGPHPRSYAQAMPQKMRRKALCSVLSDKLAEGRVHVVDSFTFAAPRTKDMLAVLQALGVDRKAVAGEEEAKSGRNNVLIVLSAPDANVTRSGRNIPGVRTTVAHTLNVLDAIDSDHLVFTEAALRTLEGVLTGTPQPQDAPADNNPTAAPSVPVATSAASGAAPEPESVPEAESASIETAPEPAAIEPQQTTDVESAEGSE